MKELMVFDLDDTLLHNKHNYSAPMLDAVKLMIEEIGPRAPYAPDIVAREDKIDKERVRQIDPVTDKLYLYNRRRFPTSLVETYRSICKDKKVGVKPLKRVEDKLLEIGERAFSTHLYKRNIHPAIHEVLVFLVTKRCELVLLSKGDPEIQNDKFTALREAGINCFTEWLIVDKKDAEMFRAIKSRYPECLHWYSVGNMYASDIVPALEAGYRGVYIPDEHWESDDSDVKVDLTRCHVLEDLSKFVSWYNNR